MLALPHSVTAQSTERRFPSHGWLGLLLVVGGWWANWAMTGLRTHWAFFILWLGYCLAVDGLVAWRTGTSLALRSWKRYVGMFLVSAPAWWLFEAINIHTHNWIYLGLQNYTRPAYAVWTSLNFTTVIPAVMGTAELMASLLPRKRNFRGPVFKPDLRTTLAFFVAGWLTLTLLLAWPRVFFPFAWISIYFILEPINVWLGNRSLTEWTREGNWRPILALWMGVLVTAFFWEMWNFLSYPKWVYDVPWGNWLHVFEMPLLGYGGYLPFALELHALYHFVMGALGGRDLDYVHIAPEDRSFDPAG